MKSRPTAADRSLGSCSLGLGVSCGLGVLGLGVLRFRVPFKGDYQGSFQGLYKG